MTTMSVQKLGSSFYMYNLYTAYLTRHFPVGTWDIVLVLRYTKIILCPFDLVVRHKYKNSLSSQNSLGIIEVIDVT